MKILILRVTIIIHGAVSLKDKRRVIRAIKDRIWSKFRASISEIAEHDAKQKAVLGIVYVSNEKNLLERIMNKMINLIDESFPGMLGDYEYTVEHY